MAAVHQAQLRAQTPLDWKGPHDLLTIVVDLIGRDDQWMAFTHWLLPSWVRGVAVRDDDDAALQIDFIYTGYKIAWRTRTSSEMQVGGYTRA